MTSSTSLPQTHTRIQAITMNTILIKPLPLLFFFFFFFIFHFSSSKEKKENKKLDFPDRTSTRYLALADIHTNGTRIVVLEVIQGKVAGAAHLEGDALAGGAIEGSDAPGAAGRHAEGNGVAGLGGLVVPRGLLGGVVLEGGDGALAGAREGVVRGLEVFLLREQEDGGALFAGVRVGNVEVEDAAGVAVDFAVV